MDIDWRVMMHKRTVLTLQVIFSVISILLTCVLPIQCKTKPWPTYRGAWFRIGYPPNYTVQPSLKGATSGDRGYDSVFFISPDKKVEFYVFSPQWSGEPTDVAVNSNTENLVSTRTVQQKGKKAPITITKISAKQGAYKRLLIDIKNGSTHKVFGVKCPYSESFGRYIKHLNRFRKSLVQFVYIQDKGIVIKKGIETNQSVAILDSVKLDSEEETPSTVLPVNPLVKLGVVKQNNPKNGVYAIKIPLKAIQYLSSKLCSKITADKDFGKQKVVAVVDFELIARRESLKLDRGVCSNVREDLATAMGESQDIKVVERGQIASALKNLKIEQSGLVDISSAKKLGRIVSADFVLLGSISDRGNSVVINARIINAESGQVKYSTSIKLAKD